MDLNDIEMNDLAERLFARLSDRFGALAQLSVADRASNISSQGPVINTAAAYTATKYDDTVIFNVGAGATVTLPSATITKGRRIRLVTITGFTVVSASANVVPLAGGAAGTGILGAVAGRWAEIESDGVVWKITAAN